MIDPQDIKVIAEGLEFPEGPIWLPDGSLLVVEIAGKKLTHIGPDGHKSTVADLDGGPNGAAIGPDGKVYICNNGGFSWTRSGGILRPTGPAGDFVGGWIERVDLANGATERILETVDERRLTGPNDIVFDSEGGFWFTDHGKKYDRHMDLGAIHHVGAEGAMQAAFPLLGPNGIGLSPDGRELYVAETPTGRIWAYPVTQTGALEQADWQSPTGGRLVCGLPGFQRYDSLAVEADGTISVACLRNGGIASVRPDGTLVGRIDLDDPYTTNICFGGEDMQTAFITLSGSGRLISAPWPRPGLKLSF